MTSIALPPENTTSSLDTHTTADSFPRSPLSTQNSTPSTDNVSTGPRTPEGKSRSAQNARKHNLSATTPPPNLLADPTYQISRREFIEEFSPQTPAQCVLVDQLTFLAWKLDQIPHLEQQLLATPIGQTTPTLLDPPKPPQTLQEHLEEQLIANDTTDTPDTTPTPPPPTDPTNELTVTHLLQDHPTPLTRLWDYHRRLLSRFQSVLRQIHQLKKQQQQSHQHHQRQQELKREQDHNALAQYVEQMHQRNKAKEQEERRQRHQAHNNILSTQHSAPSTQHLSTTARQSAPSNAPAQNELPLNSNFLQPPPAIAGNIKSHIAQSERLE